MPALGRIAPPDWQHVDKHPLTAAHVAEITTPRPVVIGVNWYPEFDEPEQDSKGHWWVAREGIGPRSRPRGGHCVALKPLHVTDPIFWYRLYNQLNEGICVAEGCSRMSSLNNRRTYQPRWLYDRCKERDGIPGEDGTFVRTGFEVLKDLGHVRRRTGEHQGLKPHQYDNRTPVVADGIAAFRWARSIDDVLNVLGYGAYDFVDVLNSWGPDYPHYTRMPASVLERLWREDGEVGIATDR